MKQLVCIVLLLDMCLHGGGGYKKVHYVFADDIFTKGGGVKLTALDC